MGSDVNKVISFILGLIVVVVFIAIVSGKLNLGSKVKTLAKKTVTPTQKAPTPSPSKKATITYPVTTSKPTTGYKSTTSNQATAPTPVVKTNNNQYLANGSNSQIAGKNLNTIPSTGAPTFLLPLAFSMLAGGTLLKRKSK